MKRLLAIVIVVVLALSGCGKEKSASELRYEQERQKLLGAWEELYGQSRIGDGFLEIKNARVIHIKHNENKYFKDVDHIVEFTVYSDYMGGAPYYDDWQVYDTVVVYKDGRMEVPQSSMIWNYRSAAYTVDFSDFLGQIEELGTAYNGVYDLAD